MPKNLVIATFNDRVHKGYTIFREATAHKDVRCVYASFAIAFMLASTSCISNLHFMPYSSDVTYHSMKPKI